MKSLRREWEARQVGGLGRKRCGRQARVLEGSGKLGWERQCLPGFWGRGSGVSGELLGDVALSSGMKFHPFLLPLQKTSETTEAIFQGFGGMIMVPFECDTVCWKALRWGERKSRFPSTPHSPYLPPESGSRLASPQGSQSIMAWLYW